MPQRDLQKKLRIKKAIQKANETDLEKMTKSLPDRDTSNRD